MTPAADPSLPAVAEDQVQAILSRHIPLYRTHKPGYQAVMLRSLSALWRGPHERVLDVGGGTGIIAQAVKELFAVPHVVSVDVSDRYLRTIDIETRVYDGSRLPFDDASFDAVMLNNVMHHVPPQVRVALLCDCARVAGSGPIYIKDHLAASWLDHARLTVLDAMGNVPFGGMVEARYLTQQDWDELAQAAACRIEAATNGPYRTGAFEWLFPNRLEITMRLTAAGPAKGGAAAGTTGLPARHSGG